MKIVVIAAGSLFFYTGSLKAQNEVVYTGNDKEAKQEKSESRIKERELRKNDNVASYQSNQEFMRDFPHAENTIWNVTRNFEEATFIAGGIETTAYYDADSQLVGTTVEKNFSDIPANAQAYIKNHFKGYRIGTVVLFDDNEDNDTDMRLYNTDFEDADNYFIVLKNDKESIIVKADMEGLVSFFKKL